MVYDTSTVITLSKSEVLDIIEEIDVFTYYLGFKPLLNQTYISPLRQDKSPSFNLFMAKNGHILYKDFGTGKSGDCIEFVKEIKQINNQTAIKEILQLFGNKQINRIPKKKKLRKVPTTKTDIEIKTMPFNEEGINYWKQFGISINTLKYFEVYQTKKVWIKETPKFSYVKGNPIFSYKLYDRFKIYQPLNSKNKFFTNCNIYYIQGWKQLKYNTDNLIITKSLKDVMLLYELGYNAVAPNAESYGIPDNIATVIKKNFKNITLFYDRDLAGMVNTRKLIKAHNFNFIFVPKYHKTKDISDFYKKFGKEETVKLLSNLIK